MEEESPELILAFIPPLILLLKAAEDKKGSPLTKHEVEAIRDEGLCIEVTKEAALQAAEIRGYMDIDPENCWDEWCEWRKVLYP